MATYKIWRFPIWAYAVVALMIIGAASGGGDNGTETNAAEPAGNGAETADQAVETEPTAAPDPTAVSEPADEAQLAAFAGRAWEAEVDAVVAGDDSPTAKIDGVAALVKSYSMTEADVTDQTSYLVEQVRSRAIVDQADDKQFMHRLAFVARSIDRTLDDADGRPEDEFAFDLWQVARDLARETETPDSEFIRANLEQLDDAIAENGW